MFEDRRDVAEADEEGGGRRDGNGTYVIFKRRNAEKKQIYGTNERWNMKTKRRVETSDILAMVAIVVSLFALYVSVKQL